MRRPRGRSGRRSSCLVAVTAGLEAVSVSCGPSCSDRRQPAAMPPCFGCSAPIRARLEHGRHAFCRGTILTHADPDRRRRRRLHPLYAAADVSRGQSGRARARRQIAGGVVALAVAAFTGVKGELAVAIPLGIFGAGLLGWSPFGRRFHNSAGCSRRRRAALGGADLARPLAISRNDARPRQRRAVGPDRRRSLGRPFARRIRSAAADSDDPGFDAKSVALLESYLDRRFPAWRQHAEGDAAGGQRRAASSGKMTDEEAYQILGLQPVRGATRSAGRTARS